MCDYVDLFWRFLLISLVAFGGSGSALSLVERMAVRETGWISDGELGFR
jgi:chromate transport protein ChrA